MKHRILFLQMQKHTYTFIATAQCGFFLSLLFKLKVCTCIIKNLENNEKLEEGNKNSLLGAPAKEKGSLTCYL